MSQSEITPIFLLESVSIGLKNVGLQNKVSVQISKFGLKYFGNVKSLSVGQKNLSTSLEKFGNLKSLSIGQRNLSAGLEKFCFEKKSQNQSR